MASYPSGVYSPRTKANKAGVVYDPTKSTIGYVEDVTKLDNEVVAIETELGANPKGTSESILERIKGIRSLSDATADTIVIKGGKVGIGTDAPAYALDIRIAAGVAGLGFYVSNSDGFLSFTNGTSTADSFAPTVQFNMKNSAKPCLFIANVPTLGEDTGTMPLFIFSSRYQNGLVTTRPSFAFRNFNTDIMVMSAAGNVGIGTSTPNANAILDVASTTKAFMPPRMTTTQRDAIASPTEGMVIFNTTTHVLNFYYTSWAAV